MSWVPGVEVMPRPCQAQRRALPELTQADALQIPEGLSVLLVLREKRDLTLGT